MTEVISRLEIGNLVTKLVLVGRLRKIKIKNWELLDYQNEILTSSNDGLGMG
jgi:hypothetical protein